MLVALIAISYSVAQDDDEVQVPQPLQAAERHAQGQQSVELLVELQARQVDLAMKWGFGHAQGPFEIWQAAGWREVADWIVDDIKAGKALSTAPLPGWALRGPVWEAQGVHTQAGSWNPSERRFEGRSTLPVYDRQVGAPRAPAVGTSGL